MRRPNATPSAGLLAALLTLSAGCSRCGAPAAGPPADRFVPSSAVGVVLVPKLADAARQLAALHGTLASLPGQYELQGARGALAAQLSFDPLDPGSMANAGLDPERGLAVAELARQAEGEPGQPLLVVPVGDEGKFGALVARLAKERLGAQEQGLENANGRSIQVWRLAAGAPALLAVATVERTALLSAGPGGPAAVRAALQLDPALSLSQSPAWQRARAALGEQAPIQVFVPAGGVAVGGATTPDALAAGLSASARSLRLVAVALLGAGEPRYRPLAAPGPGKAGPSSLAPETILAGRLSASPAAALTLGLGALGGGPPPGDPAADATRQLAEGLEPPLELGLSLLPRAAVGAALANPEELAPLRLFRVELAAGVKAGAKLAPALDALLGAAGGPPGKDGRWRLPAGDAEVAVALSGQRLLVSAGPPGGLEALTARGAGQGWKAPTAASAEALAGGLGGLVLDGDNLVKAVKALPPEAFGSGPDAVVARSLAEKLTAPGAGGAVSLRADLPAGALRLALELELAPEKPR